MAKHSEGSKRDKGEGSKKDKVHSDITEKVLHINRCSKVVKGGRKFSFSALILVHDSNGSIGIGFAKANELTDAIRKGGEAARKEMKQYPREGDTIPHEVFMHSDGARLLLKPAPVGTGVKAGSKPRIILEAAGYKDVVAKSLGSANPINLVLATIKALSQLKTRENIAAMRGAS